MAAGKSVFLDELENDPEKEDDQQDTEHEIE